MEYFWWLICCWFWSRFVGLGTNFGHFLCGFANYFGAEMGLVWQTDLVEVLWAAIGVVLWWCNGLKNGRGDSEGDWDDEEEKIERDREGLG